MIKYLNSLFILIMSVSLLGYNGVGATPRGYYGRGFKKSSRAHGPNFKLFYLPMSTKPVIPMYPYVPVSHLGTTYPGIFQPYFQHLFQRGSQRTRKQLHSWSIPYDQKFLDLQKSPASSRFHNPYKQSLSSDDPYFTFKSFYRNNGKVQDPARPNEFHNPFKRSLLSNDKFYTFKDLDVNNGNARTNTDNVVKESDSLYMQQPRLNNDNSRNQQPHYEVREHTFGKSNSDLFNNGVNNHPLAYNNIGGRVLVVTRKATSIPPVGNDSVQGGGVFIGGTESIVSSDLLKPAAKVLVVKVGAQPIVPPTVGNKEGQHLDKFNKRISDIAPNTGLPVTIDLFNDVFVNTVIDKHAHEHTVDILNGEESVLDKVSGIDSLNSLVLEKVSETDEVNRLVAATTSVDSRDTMQISAVHSPINSERTEFFDVETKSKLDNDLSNAVVHTSVSTVNPFLEPMKEMGAFGPGPYYKCHPPSRVVCGANSDWYHVIGIREWCQQNCVVDNYSSYCDDDRCSCQCVQAF